MIKIFFLTLLLLTSTLNAKDLDCDISQSGKNQIFEITNLNGKTLNITGDRKNQNQLTRKIITDKQIQKDGPVIFQIVPPRGVDRSKRNFKKECRVIFYHKQKDGSLKRSGASYFLSKEKINQIGNDISSTVEILDPEKLSIKLNGQQTPLIKPTAIPEVVPEVIPTVAPVEVDVIQKPEEINCEPNTGTTPVIDNEDIQNQSEVYLKTLIDYANKLKIPIDENKLKDIVINDSGFKKLFETHPNFAEALAILYANNKCPVDSFMFGMKNTPKDQFNGIITLNKNKKEIRNSELRFFKNEKAVNGDVNLEECFKQNPNLENWLIGSSELHSNHCRTGLMNHLENKGLCQKIPETKPTPRSSVSGACDRMKGEACQAFLKINQWREDNGLQPYGESVECLLDEDYDFQMNASNSDDLISQMLNSSEYRFYIAEKNTNEFMAISEENGIWKQCYTP